MLWSRPGFCWGWQCAGRTVDLWNLELRMVRSIQAQTHSLWAIDWSILAVSWKFRLDRGSHQSRFEHIVMRQILARMDLKWLCHPSICSPGAWSLWARVPVTQCTEKILRGSDWARNDHFQGRGALVLILLCRRFGNLYCSLSMPTISHGAAVLRIFLLMGEPGDWGSRFIRWSKSYQSMIVSFTMFHFSWQGYEQTSANIGKHLET
jgi:hypothetical protein